MEKSIILLDTYEENITVKKTDAAKKTIRRSDFDITNVFEAQKCTSFRYDLIIEIGDYRFFCNRNLLRSINNRYFDALVDADFREKKQSSIKLLDLDAEGFKLILDYIYNGKIRLRADRNYRQIVGLTSISEFTGDLFIYRKCVRYIRRTLNLKRAIELSRYFSTDDDDNRRNNDNDNNSNDDNNNSNNMNNRHPNEELLNIAIDYLIDRYVWLYGTKEFPLMSYYALKNLLASDRILIYAEEQIVLGIAYWLRYDWTTRRHLLSDLAEYIRYDFVSSDFLRKYSFAANRQTIAIEPRINSPRCYLVYGDNEDYYYDYFIERFFGKSNNDHRVIDQLKDDDSNELNVIANLLKKASKNSSNNNNNNNSDIDKDEDNKDKDNNDNIDKDNNNKSSSNNNNNNNDNNNNKNVCRIKKRLYLFGLRRNPLDSDYNNDNKTSWTELVYRYDGYRLEWLPRLSAISNHRKRQRVVADDVNNRLYKFDTEICRKRNTFKMYDIDIERWTDLRTDRNYVSAYDMIRSGDKIYINTATIFSDYYYNDRFESTKRPKFGLIHVFDLTVDNWSRLPRKPYGTDTNASCLIAIDSNVLMVCGGVNIRNCAVDTVLQYDQRVGTWTQLRSMPKKRGYAAAVRSSNDDKVYVSGGVDRFYECVRDISVRDESQQASRTVMTYSLRRNTWHTCKRLFQAKHSHQMLTNDKRVYAIADGGLFTLTESFDTVTYRWKIEFDSTGRRYFDDFHSVTGAFL